MSSDQQTLLLGEIKGLVQSLKDGQALQNARLDKIDARFEAIDGRLRTVEQRSAVFGSVSGGAMAIGMTLLIEGLKQWVKRGGPTP